jgi:hypothetical protein
MTKSKKRKARKVARAAGLPLTGELELTRDRDKGACEWSESACGYRARDRWARRYDALNGAPESEEDR